MTVLVLSIVEIGGYTVSTTSTQDVTVSGDRIIVVAFRGMVVRVVGV